MPEPKDVFFYGLFMDEELLRAKGVHPRKPRKAVVFGYKLKIGERAALSADPRGKAYGMVFALTEEEIRSLYSEPGLNVYVPQSVMASYDDGTSGIVLTYNLRKEQISKSSDPEYAHKLRNVLKRLNFPVDFELDGD